MRKIRNAIIAALLFFFINGLVSGETIEKIVVEGNKKVSRDTILFYMKSSENGLFSPDRLRDDFKALWKTGFFENITMEAENGEKGKIVNVILEENLLVKSVTYKTGKKIKETDINQKLQENNISLLAFSYHTPSKLKKVKKIIEGMLKDKGYNEGNVNIVTREANEQVAVTVEVIRGPKTRIGSVEFPGLDAADVSPFFLRRGLQHNKKHNIFSFIGGKDAYKKEKIAEDLEEIKLRLQQKGYLEAKVGTPNISYFQKANVLGKKQKMLNISIPVTPGPQYRVGDIKIEGNKIIKTEFLKRLVTLKKGKIFDVKKRDKVKEEIQRVYSSLGHIYCMVMPVENLDPVKRIADLTLNIQEGDVAYVGKLTFKGNTFTQDGVIRREWLLGEGERINMNLLESCITRMKQLGIVTIEKIPAFKPDPKNPKKVDIDVEVKEINRQSINFNVGYSGYEGLFVALGYSTQNFMGRGETLALNLQTGTQTKNYSLSFTKPYLFNLPASLGFNLHQSEMDVPNLYKKKSRGFGFSTSARFRKFFGVSLGYKFEDVESSTENASSQLSAYYQAYYNYTGTISSLSPTIYYSTVDSPIFPTSGTKVLFNYRYSGGLLGGGVNLHKTKFQFVKFIPIWKRHRHVLGIQFVHQTVTPFGDQPMPNWEKFSLGGEQSIRGYKFYDLGPRNENGYVIGGNKAFYMNLQYEVPINQQFSFIGFYDVGNAYDVGQPINLKNLYSSTGLELKVFVPMLNVPFRLIFAYNNRLLEPEDSHFVFRFAVGTSFN